MEKILRRLMKYGLRGVDTYTHNGSTWLIFTDNKQWVIELTDNKTLWYNYSFFKQLFCVATDDVVSNQNYIAKWVEDNIINKELTYVTLFRDARDRKQQFDDTLENGIKMTLSLDSRDYTGDIDDVLEKGVNETLVGSYLNVDSVIQDGVKRIYNSVGRDRLVEDTLENGIKNTKMAYMKTDWSIDDTIENGVKETNHVDVMKFFNNKMDDTLKNGVKETKQKNPTRLILDIDGRGLILETDLVIRDGVKETSHRQFLKTYDVKDTIQDETEHNRWILDGCNDPVDEVLDNGVKEVVSYDEHKRGPVNTFGYIDDIIKEGVRTYNPRQYVGGDIIVTIIDKGVKETHDDVYHHKGRIDGVIKNGVKETIDCDWDVHNQIGDVIDNGVKEIKSWSESIDGNLNQYGCVDNVINNGVKETKPSGYSPMDKIGKVVNEGIKIKNPTD